MRSPGRTTALCLGLLGLCFLAAAAFETWQRYRTVLLWKPVQATVVDRNIGFRHDGEGRLRFYTRAALRYSTPSGEQTATADSEFDSHDFAAIRSRTERYAPGTAIKAYYDPAHHGTIRFGAEYTVSYLGRTAYFYGGAATCILAGALAAALWRGTRTCMGCKTKLKYHYRYCTFCGAPVTPVPHLITNERPAET